MKGAKASCCASKPAYSNTEQFIESLWRNSKPALKDQGFCCHSTNLAVVKQVHCRRPASVCAVEAKRVKHSFVGCSRQVIAYLSMTNLGQAITASFGVLHRNTAEAPT